VLRRTNQEIAEDRRRDQEHCNGRFYLFQHLILEQHGTEQDRRCDQRRPYRSPEESLLLDHEGVGVFVYNVGPPRSLPWLLVVLFAAWTAQLVGKQIIDPTLSGFVGAAVMVPVAHLVGRVRTAPPPHVMFLPAFWLLVPGTIGLIGITELVGNNAEAGSANLGAALAAIPSVALGILVGTMIVRAARVVSRRVPADR
jgi:uncharacterized membrane protein YjjB (DUF3815 family)